MTVFTDLLSTGGCPRGLRCEQCGVEDAFIHEYRKHRVLPIVRPIPARSLGGPIEGVLCMTLCVVCRAMPALTDTPARPAIMPRTAANLIAAHAIHLGITERLMLQLTREDAHA